MLLQRVPQDEGDSPTFGAGSARRAGEGEDLVSRRSQVRDLGLITSRVQPGLRQQHDVDVVVKNERGDVGSSPGRADVSCIKETDKERVFSREGMT